MDTQTITTANAVLDILVYGSEEAEKLAHDERLSEQYRHGVAQKVLQESRGRAVTLAKSALQSAGNLLDAAQTDYETAQAIARAGRNYSENHAAVTAMAAIAENATWYELAEEVEDFLVFGDAAGLDAFRRIGYPIMRRRMRDDDVGGLRTYAGALEALQRRTQARLSELQPDVLRAAHERLEAARGQRDELRNDLQRINRRFQAAGGMGPLSSVFVGETEMFYAESGKMVFQKSGPGFW